ncbi:hypothetical protein ACL02O_32140 [Micromonospora sp. MS34]|uniref:hypothetical protein n=1 Tax=Micromonospora sp. MS34 TaxID=3385971 RepID=UPI0039A2B8F9
MPTIAIVGAGAGLGASIAKVFGGHGFNVALISRSKARATCKPWLHSSPNPASTPPRSLPTSPTAPP